MKTKSNSQAGRFRRGLELTKSSWRVLSLDKGLAVLPALSIASFILAAVAVIAGSIGILIAIYGENFSSTSPVPIIVLGVILYVAWAIIGNFFSGAVIYGATQRFRGSTPTIRSSLASVNRKLRPLVFFSLLMGSVGLGLQVLEKRLPFLAKFAVSLLGATWSIANVFALPVIVLSDKEVRPLTATRESVKIIRKVWGESVIADFGISLIALSGFLGYVGICVLFGVFDAYIGGMPKAVDTTLFALGVLGFITLSIIIVTLSAIAKAALYHYATTGEAPELFSQQLLQAAMTTKKARKIFR